ncbi:DUF262 domain-containing protein [Bacillus subtilis]|nr:DUF262 domain-containing protein [Bacillus subtilis]
MTSNGAALNRRNNNITISEFYENHSLDKYNYDPDYQRKSDVWSIEKQSFLIDSIMKNFPIPPIFLHSEVDLQSGKSIYHVIDGKQRLSAIVKFIKDELYLPENFGEDRFGDPALNGLKFSEIKTDSQFKQNFWKYSIPVEYVDTKDKDIVDKIFDRLNRNGEPLNDQELRNAKYSDSSFIGLVKELSNHNFWKERLAGVVETSRMEDNEFISELVFYIKEGIIDSKPLILDELYDKWVNNLRKKPETADEIREQFKNVTRYMQSLNLDYNRYKIKGVSHIYAVWGLSLYCFNETLEIDIIREKVDDFFQLLRSSNKDNNDVELYRNSMSYATRSKGQRKKRVDSLLHFCTQ